MALRMIIGRSGQGKTEEMLREIVEESCRHPDRNYFLIVPEQFSLEMQRRMVELHPLKGFFNIDVLSFHRLAYRIFDAAGYVPARLLEDLGVSMVLRRILSQKEEELGFFKRSVRKAGFIDELKSALMEMISCGVSWEDLEKAVQTMDDRPLLQKKCRELAMIFSEFVRETEGRFMVTEQILTLASDYVSSCGLIEGNVFYFDGFTGFTPVQLGFLGELLETAGDVHVTVTAPFSDCGEKEICISDREDLFHFSRKFTGSLLRLCRERHVDLLPVTGLDREPAPRFSGNPELAFLEKNVFRIHRETYEEVPAHIHAVACGRQDDEADFVLRQVEYLVRKRGIRYRDCAVLCGNVEEYEMMFRRKAELLKIPLFVDSKKRVTYHSGVEALRALFHLAEKNYSYESVFRYLKAGMSELEDEETDYLENYILSAGVRGHSMWAKPFERRLAGKSQESLDRLETLRRKVMEETEDFVISCRRKDSSVRDRMNSLFHEMERLDFQGKLEDMAREAESRGDHAGAGEHRKLYGLLLALLDKIVMIFGEEVLSLREVSEIMDAGLESLGLGIAPLTMDQLILGDLKRTRLTDVRVLFIAGMNDGVIPPVLEDKGLLSDEDKDFLREQGIELSAGLLERSMEEEFYMYLAFSRPSEDLYFSYSSGGRGGKQMRPSPMIAGLKKLFPAMKEILYPPEGGRYCFGINDSRQLLIEGLGRVRDRKPSWPDLLKDGDPNREDRIFLLLVKYWMDHPGCREELQADLNILHLRDRIRRVSPDLVEELYGKELYSSVSRLETFSTCPFAYLCRYGLGLEDREEFVLMDTDFGTLFHAGLQHFSELVKKSGCRWKELTAQMRDELLREAMRQALEENRTEVFDGSARDHYQVNRVRRVLDRTVRAIQLQLENSEFEPDRFELRFGYRGSESGSSCTLEDGRKLGLYGVIDRVDLCEEEGEVILRIVDYKSGERDVRLDEIYYGIQLQLILYLDAAMNLYEKGTGKKAVPGGVFYYRFQDPFYSGDRYEEDKYWQQFRMKGYANSSQVVLDKLEKGMKGLFSMSVSRNKDGSPGKKAHVMTEEDFSHLRRHALSSAKELAERIYSGEIVPEPYRKADKSDGCQYCSYLSVCGFGAQVYRDHYRQLRGMKPEEVLEKIGEEEE